MTKVAESKVMVGLEVGSHKVVAVVGEVLPDGVVNVLGVGVSPSKGIQKGSIVDLDAAVGSIKRAIEEAESISECKIVSVTLAISGSHIESYNEKGTKALSSGIVNKSDLDEAIHTAQSIKLSEGHSLFHVIPQEYKVDQLPPTKNPLGLSGMRLEAQAHLITCHNDWLRNLKNSVERCGLNIERVIFSGLASSYSVLTEDEKELGVCLIDIGGSTMDVLVYTDGALRFSQVQPYGGHDITDYIANVFATSRNEAENIKVQYGSAITPPKNFPEKKIEVAGLGGRNPRVFTKEQLSSLTTYGYNELLAVIYSELVSLKTKLDDQKIRSDLIAGIVLTGGGSQIEDIVECAKSVFGSQVRVGYPLNIAGLTDYVNKPQYATVLGLLQYSHHNEVKTEPPIIGGGHIENIMKVTKKIKNWIQTGFFNKEESK